MLRQAGGVLGIAALMCAVLVGVTEPSTETTGPVAALLQLKHKSRQVLSAVACGHPVPIGTKCPATCPFTQQAGGNRCTQFCVAENECAHLHPARTFADDETFLCEPPCGNEMEDRIAGCQTCSKRGTCMECVALFSLQPDGTCFCQLHKIWIAVYTVLFVALLIVLHLFHRLWARPIVNESVVQAGLSRRGDNLPIDDRGVLPLWGTDVRNNEDVGGVGICLYFRALYVIGALIALMALIDTFLPQVLDECQTDSTADPGRPGWFRDRVATLLSGAYVVFLVVTCIFAAKTRHGFKIQMKRFAVEVVGLPADVRILPLQDPAAWSLGRSPKGELPELVGVSVAYEYHDDRWAVERHTDLRVDMPDAPAWFNIEDDEIQRFETSVLVHRTKSTGHAIAVFSTAQAVQRVEKSGLKLGGMTFKCRPLHTEPEGVLWHAFRRKPASWHKYAMGVIQLVVTILLWGALYVPYAIFYMYTNRIPGVRVGPVQDLLLGALIAVGNFIVACTVDVVVDRFDYRYKPDRDVHVMTLCFGCVFLNTICDIFMTLKYAQGASLDDAFDSPIDKHLGYGRVLARELMSLIMPGYLLIPYLLEPLMRIVLPFWIGKLVARSDRRVTKQVAVAWLRPPPVELSWRYADVCNNLCVCWVLLFLASPRAGEAMLFYLVFLVLVGCIDKYCVLRENRSCHTSQLLHKRFCMLWGCPLTFLAASVGYWVHQSSLEQYTGWHVICCFVVGHVVMYYSLISLILREHEEELVEDYQHVLRRHEAVGRTSTYFNTNPFCILRHDALAESPFLPGWEKFHKKLEADDTERRANLREAQASS